MRTPRLRQRIVRVHPEAALITHAMSAATAELHATILQPSPQRKNQWCRRVKGAPAPRMYQMVLGLLACGLEVLRRGARGASGTREARASSTHTIVASATATLHSLSAIGRPALLNRRCPLPVSERTSELVTRIVRTHSPRLTPSFALHAAPHLVVMLVSLDQPSQRQLDHHVHGCSITRP